MRSTINHDNIRPLVLTCWFLFRWYRVIGLDAEAQVSGDVWTRDVVLDGPDFVFEELMGTPNPQMLTYGTIVGGVVTIIERQVRLQ